MTNKIDKALRKLSRKEFKVVRLLLMRIEMGDTDGMDIKMLRGHTELFRVRKGRLRIVFRKGAKDIELVKIDQRDDQTYKEF